MQPRNSTAVSASRCVSTGLLDETLDVLGGDRCWRGLLKNRRDFSGNRGSDVEDEVESGRADKVQTSRFINESVLVFEWNRKLEIDGCDSCDGDGFLLALGAHDP